MSAFESLRQPDRAVDPDRRFAEQLRARIAAELAPTIELPERNTDMNTITTDTSTDVAAASAATLVPYLAIAGADRAIAWYADVFGARETTRYVADDGRIGHAEVEIGGARIMLSDEYPDFDAVAPTSVGATSVTMNLNVSDVDAVWAKAVDGGADGKRPPEDQPYGERSCTFVDPFGHRWMVQTTVAHPSPAEVDDAMEGFTVVTPAGTSNAPEPVTVEIGYVTIPVDDTARATAFYGALFGWQSEPGNSGDGYAHVANTELPLGFTPDGNDSSPSLYFRVDDAEATAVRATELGGEIIERATYDSGANVVCRDDQGRTFLLWQPAEGY